MSNLRKKFRILSAVGLVAGLALACTLTEGVVNPPPAQAATIPGFQIYYNPDCANAYRTYATTGTYRSERFVNDTFNSGKGLKGYGQKIRENAASIRIQPLSQVKISQYDDTSGGVTYYNSSSKNSVCVNIADHKWGYPQLRNANRSFILQPYRNR